MFVGPKFDEDFNIIALLCIFKRKHIREFRDLQYCFFSSFLETIPDQYEQFYQKIVRFTLNKVLTRNCHKIASKQARSVLYAYTHVVRALSDQKKFEIFSNCFYF